MAATAKQWLERIHALPHQKDKVKIMNVCGGHERSITMAGLRKALPDYIELVPGPGCPVCICPEEDIFEAIQLALNEDIILVAFGDMLRVPVNVPKAKARTLEQAKAQGADIRPIASPTEAVTIAKDNPDKAVVFFAAGFETTTAPVAAMMVEGVPDNLAPGHVSTIMGPEEWNFVVDKHHIPAAVAGFQPESLLAAMYSTLRQLNDKRYFLDNCYQILVKPGGNKSAQAHLNKAMNVYDANWRGVGIIPKSGYELDEVYSKHDARKLFPSYADDARKRAGQMPPGCDCAQVVLGKIYPNECKLFGKACIPRNPIGPCMVSDEGRKQLVK